MENNNQQNTGRSSENLFNAIIDSKNNNQNKSKTNLYILQWVNYGLMLWQAWSMILTFGLILYYKSLGSAVISIVYPLISIIALDIASTITEFKFAKSEPREKSGASSALTVIYAVLIINTIISALITMLFIGLGGLLFKDIDFEGKVFSLALFSVVILSVIALRLFRPARLDKLVSKHVYNIFMSVVTVILLILAITYPIASLNERTTDRLIENNINSLAQVINSHYEKNDELPADLKELSITNNNVKKLVDDNLVTYKIDEKGASQFDDSESSVFGNSYFSDFDRVGLYQLCVDYKFSNGIGDFVIDQDDDYSTSISTTSHPSGNVCYKVSTSYYYQ